MTPTPSTIRFEPGTVVRVLIRFTSGQRTKKRPAVVLTSTPYHASRSDAIVLALSSQVGASYHGDCELVDWLSAGLPLPTKAKGVIETVDRLSIDHQYGILTADDLERIKDSVRTILGL